MIKKILIIIATISMFSCKSDKEKVTSNTWKYYKGYHIGDVLEFNTNYFTIDDSCKIYKDGTYSAKVGKVNGKKLEIKSVDNKIGYYTFLEVTKK